MRKIDDSEITSANVSLVKLKGNASGADFNFSATIMMIRPLLQSIHYLTSALIVSFMWESMR